MSCTVAALPPGCAVRGAWYCGACVVGGAHGSRYCGGHWVRVGGAHWRGAHDGGAHDGGAQSGAT